MIEVAKLRCSSLVIRQWLEDESSSSEYARRLLRLADAYDQLAAAMTLPPTRFRRAS